MHGNSRAMWWLATVRDVVLLLFLVLAPLHLAIGSAVWLWLWGLDRAIVRGGSPRTFFGETIRPITLFKWGIGATLGLAALTLLSLASGSESALETLLVVLRVAGLACLALVAAYAIWCVDCGIATIARRSGRPAARVERDPA